MINATVKVTLTVRYQADGSGMSTREMQNEAEEMVLEYVSSKLTPSRRARVVGGMEAVATLHASPVRRRR